jgi:hypothetical protein
MSLHEIASRELASISRLPGTILYSSSDTLKRGDVYLLGFNPGGSDGNILSHGIDQLIGRTQNAYLDEAWENGNGSWAAGEAPLQKNIIWLLTELNLNPRDVCASNLIFLQSREASGISYDIAKVCWPVHEAILEIVQPQVIITFGNSEVSPYAFLKQMLNGSGGSFEPSGHGTWQLKSFEAKVNDRNIRVIGLPHLSRYSPKGKPNVSKWLKMQATI